MRNLNFGASIAKWPKNLMNIRTQQLGTPSFRYFVQFSKSSPFCQYQQWNLIFRISAMKFEFRDLKSRLNSKRIPLSIVWSTLFHKVGCMYESTTSLREKFSLDQKLNLATWRSSYIVRQSNFAVKKIGVVFRNTVCISFDPWKTKMEYRLKNWTIFGANLLWRLLGGSVVEIALRIGFF